MRLSLEDIVRAGVRIGDLQDRVLKEVCPARAFRRQQLPELGIAAMPRTLVTRPLSPMLNCVKLSAMILPVVEGCGAHEP